MKMVTKRFLTLILALVFISLTLTGCFGAPSEPEKTQQPDTSPGGETADPDPTPFEGKDSVVIGITEPSELVPDLSTDLTGKQIFANIYDNLMIMDKEGNYVPQLAEKFEISEDSLVYTFYLRKGVKFHNGEDFTAEDVEYTIERYKANTRTAKYYMYYDHCEIVDDHTIKLCYSKVYGATLECLFSPRGSMMLDKTTCNDPTVDLLKTPIGTGPFKFISRSTGDKVVLERFEEYWGEKPTYKDLIWKIVNDSNAAVIALETGEVDLVYAVSESQRELVEANPDLKMASELIAGTAYLAINTKDPVTQDVRIRQAIVHAINKEELLLACEEGNGMVTTNILAWNAKGTPDMKTFQDISYDIEASKRLLTEAGYPNGIELTLHTTQERPTYYNIAQALQGQLAKANITLKLEVTDYATMVERVNGNHSFQLNVNMYSLLAQDNATFMPQMLHSAQASGQTNYVGYENPEVDRLLETARDAASDKEMADSYKSFAEIIRDDAPFVPLYAYYSNVAHNAHLQGVVANSMSIMYAKDWHWGE